MTLFSDLLQKRNGKPKPEHKWPSEDFWRSIGSEDELDTETSSESEDELDTETSSESEDEQGPGTSSE